MSESVHAVVANKPSTLLPSDDRRIGPQHGPHQSSSSTSSNINHHQQHQQNNNINHHHQNHNNRNHHHHHHHHLRHEIESASDCTTDEDDDIDIIGKFDHHNSPSYLSAPIDDHVQTAAAAAAAAATVSTRPVNTLYLGTAPFPPTVNLQLPHVNVNDSENVLHDVNATPGIRNNNNNNNNNNLFVPELSPDLQRRQQQVESKYDQISPTSPPAPPPPPPTPPQQRQHRHHHHHQQQQDGAAEWATEHHFVPSRDRLRRALRYYFMSPIDKWRIKGRFPWKLLFQLIKIILVTSQVILFGNSVTEYKAINTSMLVSLHNLFLLNWDVSRDYKIVPPENGPYAVYTKAGVYDHLDYAIKNYANIAALTVGAFGYQAQYQSNCSTQRGGECDNDRLHIEACYQRYANVTINPSTASYFIDPTLIDECFTIDYPYSAGAPEWANFSYAKYIADHYPAQLNFDSLLYLSLKLPLRTILLNSAESVVSSTLSGGGAPQCFDLDVAINFEAKTHSGEIHVGMSNRNRAIACNGNLDDHNTRSRGHTRNAHIAVNIIVTLLCTISLLLCIRSLWRAQSLRRRTSRFFALAYRRNLDAASALHFIDGWILMILLNDCLLLLGTGINLTRQTGLIAPHRLSLRPIDFDNLCSALLGVGILLVWCGLLRYFAFFPKYNLLLVTVKHAITRVLRFLLCVSVIYAGFCFSGWIILGPYHYKYETLSGTSECLFALMNGDDVFATFAYLQPSPTFVWWFSRGYLYIFVTFFIYVVLSLFIAILMDSYETIKDYYVNRRGKKIKGDLLFANDALARFIASDDGHAADDNWSSYRVSLLHDDEIEYQHRFAAESNDHTDHDITGSSGTVPTSHCCLCHCWRWLAVMPFVCIANAFARLRDKIRRVPMRTSSGVDETAPLSVN